MIQALFFILSSYFFTVPHNTAQTEVTTIPFKEIINDTTMTLQDASGDRGLVLIFYEKGCPYNKHYKPRLNELISHYQPYGFKFALITVKDTLNTGLKTNYIFKDQDKIIRKDLGAKKSPEVFVYAKKYDRLSIEYHGAIDNNPLDSENITEHYLKEALNSILERRKLSKISTTPYGCYLD